MNASEGLVSASRTLSECVGYIGVTLAISARLHYEEIYETKIKQLGIDKKEWLDQAIDKWSIKTFRKNLTDHWDIEFAWDMWQWFVEGLEEGLLGDNLFDFIKERYDEYIESIEWDDY